MITYAVNKGDKYPNYDRTYENPNKTQSFETVKIYRGDKPDRSDPFVKNVNDPLEKDRKINVESYLRGTRYWKWQDKIAAKANISSFPHRLQDQWLYVIFDRDLIGWRGRQMLRKGYCVNILNFEVRRILCDRYSQPLAKKMVEEDTIEKYCKNNRDIRKNLLPESMLYDMYIPVEWVLGEMLMVYHRTIWSGDNQICKNLYLRDYKNRLYDDAIPQHCLNIISQYYQLVNTDFGVDILYLNGDITYSVKEIALANTLSNLQKHEGFRWVDWYDDFGNKTHYYMNLTLSGYVLSPDGRWIDPDNIIGWREITDKSTRVEGILEVANRGIFTKPNEDIIYYNCEEVTPMQEFYQHYCDLKASGVKKRVNIVNSGEGLVKVCRNFDENMPGLPVLPYEYGLVKIDRDKYVDTGTVFSSKLVSEITNGKLGEIRDYVPIRDLSNDENEFVFNWTKRR